MHVLYYRALQPRLIEIIRVEVRLIWFMIILIVFGCLPLAAQSNEFTFSKGVGWFEGGRASQNSRVGSLTYSRTLTDAFAVEGGMDWFFLRGDGFAGFQIGGVFHFRPPRATRKITPFVGLSIGNTSTDFTEVPARAVYHARAGLKYFVFPAFGARLEFEERLLHTSNDGYFQGAGRWAQLPSFAIGISLRH